MFNRAIFSAMFALCIIGCANPASARSLISDCYDISQYTDSSPPQLLDQNTLPNFGVTCNSPIGGVSADRWDTRVFIGLAISFGGEGKTTSKNVHLTAGVRRTNVNSNGRVWGGELHTSVNVHELTDWQVRALGLYGNTSISSNAGAGWDFKNDNFIMTSSVQIPYLRGMVDYYPTNGSFRPFIELNSYDKIRSVSSAQTCAAQQTLGNEVQIADAFNTTIFQVFNGGIITGSVRSGDSNINVSGVANPATWKNGVTCFTSPTAPP